MFGHSFSILSDERSKASSKTCLVKVKKILNLTLECYCIYRGADKSLARTTSQCILFDGENISFDASLVIYIYI